MPVYEHDCARCGPFTELRPLALAGASAPCPHCGRAAPKIFSAVNLRAMRPENRQAWERNERSAHAPHVCGTGCTHGHAKPKAKARARPGDKPALQYSTKENRRPWMLGH